MPADPDLLDLTAAIVAAHVAHSPVDIEQLPELIRSVHRTLARLALGWGSAPTEQEQLEPAVPIHRSVTPDYIVCLECGQRVAILKRHLGARHRMGPETYRTRWGLPREYPLVAPRYAERRSAMAKEVGLGRSRPPAASTTPAR